jgi:hypothetical protein
MDDDQMASLGFTFFVILFLIGSAFGFYNMGAFYGRKEAINQTTIECIEKPNVCKDRYEYLKLGEKLQEN